MKIKRHVSNRVLVLLMAILSIFPLMAQQIEVAGTVSDKDGEPLIGASVLVVGAKLGAATDIDYDTPVFQTDGVRFSSKEEQAMRA